VAELLKIETDLTKRGIALVLLSVGGQVSVGVGHAESHLGLHAEGRTDVLKAERHQPETKFRTHRGGYRPDGNLSYSMSETFRDSGESRRLG
jgi:hypothetical protein